MALEGAHQSTCLAFRSQICVNFPETGFLTRLVGNSHHGLCELGRNREGLFRIQLRNIT